MRKTRTGSGPADHAACLLFDAGRDEERRLTAYRGLFERAISDDELADIRAYVQQQKALGSPRFQARIAEQLARKVEVLPRGRPRKPLDSDARAAEARLPFEK
jgi:putative transposase